MKFVIFNADDFGYTRGVNRGIAEAHRNGVDLDQITVRDEEDLEAIVRGVHREQQPAAR